MALSGEITQPGPSASFKGALSADLSDPNTLAGWLQGRGEIVYRNQKPLRVSGNLNVTPDRLAIDGLKAEIDGGTLEGRVAVSNRSAGEGSRIEAALKADRLDLDAERHSRVRSRDLKANGRTRSSCRSTSAGPYPLARSCVHWWRS